LAKELQRRGAIVHFAWCPNEAGLNGPDDCLGRFGPEWGLKEIETARLFKDARVMATREAENEEKPPQFPETAWTGFFREYRDAVIDACESPACFHHAALSSVIPSLFAGSVRWQYGGRQPITDYAVLVGVTGFARKDTAKRL